jgi:hypothetical protein
VISINLFFPIQKLIDFFHFNPTKKENFSTAYNKFKKELSEENIELGKLPFWLFWCHVLKRDLLLPE